MMNIRAVFDFYIQSNLHVALAVCSLSMITHLKFGLTPDPYFLLFIFFGTVVGYNFIQYFNRFRINYGRGSVLVRNILFLTILCCIGMMISLTGLKPELLLYVLILGFLTYLYAVPLLPIGRVPGRKINLRTISGLKIYLVALVWTGVVAFLPLKTYASNLEFDMWMHMVQVFLYVFAATLPFEIRDLTFDSLQLATLPQQLGINATKSIGIAALLVFMLLEGFKDVFWIDDWVVIIIIGLLLGVLVLMSSPRQNRYFSAFWIEGIPVLWLILELGIG